ncbi:MAG TPA: radical SAM protein [Candidatus Sumerlaeia bacterium]|nr:MAG: Oxygen-independent coproporphyrinogen-III oxidase 1 [candidate division BRC1 bacterium ADurb.Bin183]HRR31553.1 radical SAM protein [Candidatus Sumerlaeia bacterium]HRS00477.1 radical SAM protein [Candidatus Sumerlaeia bacterium]
MKRVLLIVPPTGKYIREDRCQTPIEKLKTVALRPPIDLMYSAAAFEQAGCSCRLIDLPAEGKSWDDLRSELREFNPDILAISITTPSLEQDVRAAEMAKEINPAIFAIAKGAHFNTLDLDAMERYSALDAVLQGEYEITCYEIGKGRPLESIAGMTWRDTDGKIRRNPPRPFCEDLDSLPFPARHLVRNEIYIRPDTGEPQTTIVTNRGCPFSCIFCLANQVAGRKNRVRSHENILAEMEECVSRYNIRNFLFRSDLFTANKTWVIELCDKIVARKMKISWACNSRVDTIDADILAAMKRAGCWLIAFGVESGEQEILDKMNKKLKKEEALNALKLTRRAGIRSSIYFLFGLPWDSPDVFETDLAFAKKLDPDFIEIFYVYPFPGTRLYEIAVQEGLLKDGEIPLAAYDSPAMPTLHLKKEELAQWRRRFLRRFYLRPAYILRTLSQLDSFSKVWNYTRYGFRQLMDLLSINDK